MKENAKKSVEFIWGSNEIVENEIEKRIAEGRIIKDIKTVSVDSLMYSKVLVLYDTVAEEKE